jgi:chromosome segregation ATPase
MAAALCEELERERARLARAASDAWADEPAPRGQLESAIAALEENEAKLDDALGALDAAVGTLQAITRREDRLERSLARANAVAATAQQQLDAERAWVARQVALIEASQSWRLGHRLVSTLRALTMRQDGSTDALSVILRQLGDGGQSSRGE